MFLESARISKLLNSNPNAKTKQINYKVKKNTYWLKRKKLKYSHFLRKSYQDWSQSIKNKLSTNNEIPIFILTRRT